jgi:hypothetical protein
VSWFGCLEADGDVEGFSEPEAEPEALKRPGLRAMHSRTSAEAFFGSLKQEGLGVERKGH